jgi:hypothetical protein
MSVSIYQTAWCHSSLHRPAVGTSDLTEYVLNNNDISYSGLDHNFIGNVVYLFYVLFNEDVNSSDYTVTNVGMIKGL